MEWKNKKKTSGHLKILFENLQRERIITGLFQYFSSTIALFCGLLGSEYDSASYKRKENLTKYKSIVRK